MPVRSRIRTHVTRSAAVAGALLLLSMLLVGGAGAAPEPGDRAEAVPALWDLVNEGPPFA